MKDDPKPTSKGERAGPIADVSPSSCDETNGNAVTPTAQDAANGERAPWLAPHRWKPGQSGNPSGRPRETGSLAAALRRVGVKPAKTRAELSKLAQQLGLDPDEAKNIDVVAGLIYDGITQLLIRTIKGQGGAGDKLVGLLQIVFKALDGDERRITFSGPGDIETALTSVSAVLGFRAAVHPLPDSGDAQETPMFEPTQETSPSPKPSSSAAEPEFDDGAVDEAIGT